MKLLTLLSTIIVTVAGQGATCFYCGEGKTVADPDTPIQLVGFPEQTCGEFAADVLSGMYPTVCDALTTLIPFLCGGCVDISTEAPVGSVPSAPVSTGTPAPVGSRTSAPGGGDITAAPALAPITPNPVANPACYVCGDEDMTLAQPSDPVGFGFPLTCGELELLARAGLYDTAFCDGLISFLPIKCGGCVGTSTEVTPATEAPVDPVTSAFVGSSMKPACEPCGAGIMYTSPNSPVGIPGVNMTCGEFEVLAVAGTYDVVYCNGISEFLVQQCGCPSGGNATTAPSAAPITGPFAPCEVCEPGRMVANPDQPLGLGGFPNVTCAEFEASLMEGIYDTVFCSGISELVEIVCGCP